MLFSSLLSLAALAQLGLANPLPLSTRAKTAADFYVDGAHIPGISNQTGDLGPSYAGLLPISSNPNDSRKFFFWWWPHNSNGTGKGGSDDDLVIWLNGGPGCSSLEGMLEENGPFKLTSTKPNVTTATVNPYSYNRLSNVLWIEQPVSVGLGSGKPDITDENGVASEFYGFLRNFYATFPQLKGKKLWVTGESYAGQYIPYIVDYIYKQNDTFNLQGFAVNDPSIVNDDFGEEIPSYQFALDHQKELGLNASYIEKIKRQAKRNGITTYLQDELVFPPKGKILSPKALETAQTSVWELVYEGASDANACFDVYNIHTKCPAPLDPLGFAAGSQDASAANFLNQQAGFKEYVHADPKKTWYECTPKAVFAGKTQRDQSPHPADTGLLGSVIDRSKRSIIMHGLLDYVLLANGSLLGIQNTTWHGQQGFQTAPTTPLIVDGQNAGTYHTERSLTWATIEGSGHMVPQDKPKTAFKLQQYLLGQIPEAQLGQ